MFLFHDVLRNPEPLELQKHRTFSRPLPVTQRQSSLIKGKINGNTRYIIMLAPLRIGYNPRQTHRVKETVLNLLYARLAECFFQPM